MQREIGLNNRSKVWIIICKSGCKHRDYIYPELGLNKEGRSREDCFDFYHFLVESL